MAVIEQKLSILEMKEQVSSITEQENVSEDQLKSHVEANKDQFKKALEYLSKNSE